MAEKQLKMIGDVLKVDKELKAEVLRKEVSWQEGTGEVLVKVLFI